MNGAQWAKRLRPFTWGLARLGVVAIVAWQIWGGQSAGSRADDTAVTQVGVTMYTPGQRMAVPTLQGRTLDGDQFDLADLAGKIVVINVWGSWCGPCRTETPDLVRVARQRAAQGIRFVGIDTRDNLQAAQAFTHKYKVP